MAKPPRLCAKVCRAGQATKMATAGEPAEQAGTKSAETAAPAHQSVQGRAGNNNGNSRRASEQAGTQHGETTVPVHKSVQGRAGNNNGNNRRASRASRHRTYRSHRSWAQKCAGQSRQQQWQQQASQQGKQASQTHQPPCLCTKVCRARQATTMATAGGPARQAGTKQAETAAPAHKSVQGSAGNNNGNSKRTSRASRQQKCRNHRACAQKYARQGRQQQ